MIFCETERLKRKTGGMAALYMVIVRMEGWFGVNDENHKRRSCQSQTEKSAIFQDDENHLVEHY
jgi:hypothetical protein